MPIHSLITISIAVGLIVYTAYRTIQTRKWSYGVWLGAGLMLLLRGLTDMPVWTWAFISGIAACIILQRFENRPMTSERFMAQIHKEIERDRRRGRSGNDS